MERRRRILGPVLAALLCAAPAPDVLEPGVEVEDQIDVVEVDRRLIAVSSVRGTIFEQPLELTERVMQIRSQGLMGVASTNVRLLGATAGSSRFKPLTYRVAERKAPPPTLQVTDRVALVPLVQRVVALAASSANWAQLELGPNEELRSAETATNLALVITDRRAVAFSPASGGFVAEPLTPEEEIESISLQDSSVTLETARRVLVFRAGMVNWATLIRTDKR